MSGAFNVVLADILKAHERISPFIHHTPVITNSTFDKLVGRNVFFKAENLQKTGSFKARGALNAVLTVKEKDPNVTGVVTHSSGNHGQALAWAAKMAKLPCTVVVPNNFSAVKVEAIKGYGAELVLCEPTPASRQETCDRVGKEKSFTFIPPYDHYDVIAGQTNKSPKLDISSFDPFAEVNKGTMAVEFLKQVPDLDAILVPVSGGGMISGIAIAAKTIKPDIKVFMVEPEGKMAEESLRAGERLWPDPPGFLNTIADGIRLQQLGHITWPIILELVEKDVFSVSDEEMIKGMQFTFQRMKLVIEAASGAGVAAVMSEKMATMDPSIKNIGVILCGGNVDINNLPWYKI